MAISVWYQIWHQLHQLPSHSFSASNGFLKMLTKTNFHFAIGSSGLKNSTPDKGARPWNKGIAKLMTPTVSGSCSFHIYVCKLYLIRLKMKTLILSFLFNSEATGWQVAWQFCSKWIESRGRQSLFCPSRAARLPFEIGKHLYFPFNYLWRHHGSFCNNISNSFCFRQHKLFEVSVIGPEG